MSKLKYFRDRQGNRYSYNTTVTDCEKCMDFIKHKCTWEQITRLKCLIEYPNNICDSCKEIIGIKELSNE